MYVAAEVHVCLHEIDSTSLYFNKLVFKYRSCPQIKERRYLSSKDTREFEINRNPNNVILGCFAADEEFETRQSRERESPTLSLSLSLSRCRRCSVDQKSY